jgi:thiol-disulfide isomerase/thioredoxin
MKNWIIATCLAAANAFYQDSNHVKTLDIFNWGELMESDELWMV